MRKIKKKKKINKKILIVLIIIIIGLIVLKYKPTTRLKTKNDKKDTLITYILDNTDDELITKDFLNYIADNYKTSALESLKVYLENETYNKDTWHEITGNSFLVLNDLYQKKYAEMSNIKVIDKQGEATISFVGDVSLADNWYIAPKYDERKKGIYGILAEDVVSIMKNSDIMVANSEFTISNRGERIPGKAYTFRASPERISIYSEMGVNLLTLANNHVYDFGGVAFNDMIDSLNEHKMPYIGAGKNIDEAKRPYYFILNGYKIAFVNATRAEKNILTPEATATSSGVFRCYDPTNFKNLINEVKKESDYVIALIHWGREDSHQLEEVQIDTAKTYIDAGADAIIGTHAHFLQGMSFYNHKPIIYNLGDFIFNNESKDTGIFQIKLSNNGEMSYYFIPAYEANEYTKLLTGSEKARVINNINSWSTNAKLDSDGELKEK